MVDVNLCSRCSEPMKRRGRHWDCENPKCPGALHLVERQGRFYVQRFWLEPRFQRPETWNLRAAPEKRKIYNEQTSGSSAQDSVDKFMWLFGPPCQDGLGRPKPYHSRTSRKTALWVPSQLARRSTPQVLEFRGKEIHIELFYSVLVLNICVLHW